jgi:hypothetical protein
MQAAGWPDLWIGLGGLAGWFELKVGDRELTVKQQQRIRMLRRQGIPAVVLRLNHVLGVIYAEGPDGENEWNYNAEYNRLGHVVRLELVRLTG